MKRNTAIAKLIEIGDLASDIFIVGCGVILLLIGSYCMADNIYVFYHSTAAKAQVYRPDMENPDADALKELSEDCVAWLTIDDTQIDYPIMQGENNAEYLNKDPYGEYSLSGSIFLDSRNASDFSDDYSLLYGHHMEKGFMFGCLDSWKDGVFFREHQHGTVMVGNRIYNLYVFAYAEADAQDMEIFSPTEHYPLPYIKEHAVNFIDPIGQRIIVLSTCADANSTTRHIVAATLGEKGE